MSLKRWIDEIWKGEWQSQHFCFQRSLFLTHTIKKHGIAAALHLKHTKMCVWNQVRGKQEAALLAYDQGSFLEHTKISTPFTGFCKDPKHKYWLLFFETSAHYSISQGTCPFRGCQILLFPFPCTWKTSKALCTHKCEWDQEEKPHFRALHSPSRQVDKPQKVRKDRFPTCQCFAHLRQSRDCSWLPGRAEQGQPTHAAASPPALLPSRLEQHFHWFTKHPRRGLFLELISFRLLHLALPRHL